MISGVYGSLDIQPDPEREYVVFLTDGLIGNENVVLGAIEDNLGAARVFTFGLGNSTNRWLLEEMAIAGAVGPVLSWAARIPLKPSNDSWRVSTSRY